MKRPGAVLFLLGAGASVDSGLSTYRGANRYNKFDETRSNTNPVHVSALDDETRLKEMWQHFENIKKDIPDEAGETYQKIKAISAEYENSMIVTQNIDGLAQKISDNVVELHGSLCDENICLKCHKPAGFMSKCRFCEGWTRPNVLMFGEELPGEKFGQVARFINDYRPKVLYVIGTSLRFRYLTNIIRKAKLKCAKIIHINPDPEYKFHLQRESYERCGFTGETRLKIRKKKKPEELRKSL